MIPNREEGRKLLTKLIGRYIKHRSDYLSSEYNETQTRNDYINPLLEILGWDVKNEQKAPQFLRDVIQEESIEVVDEIKLLRKKPDYTIRIDGKRKFFLEAKKPTVNILESKDASFQIRRYGWNANLPISLLSNFETLVVYDCRYKPEADDDVRVARVKTYSYNEFLNKFDEIYDLLSKDSVCTGYFDTVFSVDMKPKGSEPFDEYFLEQIEKWREEIAVNLLKNNLNLSQPDLNYLIQQTINRIIFLRICEDMELEKYEDLKAVKDYDELKKIFLDADKKYDSGLFDFIEDKLSLKVNIDDSVLISIFRELYYPQNPYAFSVVDPHIMGEIYELFLSKELIISRGKKISVQEKPEVIQSKGAVSTPQYIVDSIIDETLMPLVKGKTPQEISRIRIADIAFGSGIFLLAAYDFLLNYHLDWYINNKPSRYKDKVIKLSNGEWKLTLLERNRILLNNIFGVDIDYQSVEVTKFSLLLRILENVTMGEVSAYLKKFKTPVLPNLNDNIQWGNSLVDNGYFRQNTKLHKPGQLVDINPFDFEGSFRMVFDEKGFDVIVGNPPYIRIQNIFKYSPLEVGYFKSNYSPYESSKSNNYDKYYLFIERGLSLLKPSGYLGYIVPHKFIAITAGEHLRRIIASKSYLSRFTHFGVNQVFDKKSSTYTCILILQKSMNPNFEVEFVHDLKAWSYGVRGKTYQFPSSSISDAPWIFAPPELGNFLDRIRDENESVLRNEADIFVGVQTSADKIYVIKPSRITRNLVQFEDIRGEKHSIEKGILKPCLLDVPIDCYGKPEPNALMIFPYRIIDNKAQLYLAKEMKELFPRCWDYLKCFRDELERRNIQGYTKGTWYRFGRSQSLTKFNEKPKLIWPVLSLEPRYAYDDTNVLITGGGNGPYYALRPKETSRLSIYYLLAVLSHPGIEVFVKVRSSKFRGGYGSHGKQFIANVPIRVIDFDNEEDVEAYNDIVKATKDLISLNESSSEVTTPMKKRLYERQYPVLRNRLNEQIERLYKITSDELEVIRGIP